MILGTKRMALFAPILLVMACSMFTAVLTASHQEQEPNVSPIGVPDVTINVCRGSTWTVMLHATWPRSQAKSDATGPVSLIEHIAELSGIDSYSLALAAGRPLNTWCSVQHGVIPSDWRLAAAAMPPPGTHLSSESDNFKQRRWQHFLERLDAITGSTLAQKADINRADVGPTQTIVSYVTEHLEIDQLLQTADRLLGTPVEQHPALSLFHPSIARARHLSFQLRLDASKAHFIVAAQGSQQLVAEWLERYKAADLSFAQYVLPVSVALNNGDSQAATVDWLATVISGTSGDDHGGNSTATVPSITSTSSQTTLAGGVHTLQIRISPSLIPNVETSGHVCVNQLLPWRLTFPLNQIGLNGGLLLKQRQDVRNLTLIKPDPVTRRLGYVSFCMVAQPELDLKLPFATRLLKEAELEHDTFRATDMPPATIVVGLASRDSPLALSSNWASVDGPVADFSMPYNAMMIVCTLLSIAVSSVMTTTVGSLRPKLVKP